jgi:hypothetical protein
VSSSSEHTRSLHPLPVPFWAQFALLDHGTPTIKYANPNPNKLDSYGTLHGLKTIPGFICRPLNDYPPEVERAELTYCGEFNDSHTAFQLGVYATFLVDI